MFSLLQANLGSLLKEVRAVSFLGTVRKLACDWSLHLGAIAFMPLNPRNQTISEKMQPVECKSLDLFWGCDRMLFLDGYFTPWELLVALMISCRAFLAYLLLPRKPPVGYH